LTGGNGLPAIHSNAILPTLQIIASNGITTTIRAIFERAVAHKKLFQAYLNLSRCTNGWPFIYALTY